MFLKRKIAASGIAEMVMAISIIAICIGLASIIFLRTTSVMTSFENLSYQTEIQNQIFDKLLTDKVIEIPDGVIEEIERDKEIQINRYRGRKDKIIWTQDFSINE